MLFVNLLENSRVTLESSAGSNSADITDEFKRTTLHRKNKYFCRIENFRRKRVRRIKSFVLVNTIQVRTTSSTLRCGDMSKYFATIGGVGRRSRSEQVRYRVRHLLGSSRRKLMLCKQHFLAISRKQTR